MRENTKRVLPRFLVAMLLAAALLAGLLLQFPAIARADADFDCATAADITDALADSDSVINIRLVNATPIDLGSFTGAFFQIPAGKTVNLDLNGCTIQGTRDGHVNTSMFQLNGGAFNISDSSLSETGLLTMSSTHPGNNNTTGCYVIENIGGTLTIDSGNFTNTGICDVPYVINNMTQPSAAADVITTINGGNFEAAGVIVRQYTLSNSVRNVLIVNGGTLKGGTSGLWIQQRAGAESQAELYINGGTIEGERYSGIYVTSHYTPSNSVLIEITDGVIINHSSDTNSGYVYPHDMPTIYVAWMEETGPLPDVEHTILITGGEFRNTPDGRNLTNNYWEGRYGTVSSENFDIQGGIFTYDPTEFVKTANMPVASLTRNGEIVEYYVNDEYILDAIANTQSGDIITIMSGTHTIASGESASILQGVELVVASGAAMRVAGTATNNGTITNNGTLQVAGTLTNNTLIQNNGTFNHITGVVDGQDGAWIKHGPAAQTDASAASTVFFVDTATSGRLPVTAGGVQNKSYEFKSANSWKVFRLEVIGGTGGGDFASGASAGIVAEKRAGETFLYWQTSHGGVFDDHLAESTLHTMPKNGVVVEAVFEKAGTQPDSTPATGDASPIMGYGLLLLLAGALIAIILGKKEHMS